MKKTSVVLATAVASTVGFVTPQIASAQHSLMDLSYQVASARHDELTGKLKERKRKPFSPAAETVAEVTEQDTPMDHSQHSQHMDHSTMDHSSMAHTAHHHGQGMWMFEYRFMRMYMEGMLDGAKSVNPQDLLPPLMMGEEDRYPDYVNADGDRETMVSEDMTMDMHMFMAMYAFSDRFTGMVMFNYLDNEMNMTMQMNDPMMGMAMNMPMYMESSGIGDTQLGFSYKLDNYFLYDPLFSFQVNIPTGSIDVEDDINGGMQPYSMQLGTGSYDYMAALSFKGGHENWGIGIEGSYTWRMMNEQNYNRGDTWRLRGWTTYDMNFSPFSLTFRAGIDHTNSDPIKGRDERIMENPMYYGGMRTDLRLGLNVGLPYGFMVEGQYAVPIHQNVNGYQMKDDYMLELALQWMF